MSDPSDESRCPRPTADADGAPRLVRASAFVLMSQPVRDAHRIAIAGELAVETAALLDAETVSVCGQREGTGLDLLLDLTEVTFLDMMGVAALRRVHYRALLQGRLRLGLPVAAGPSRLLDIAVEQGWLPPVFGPETPAC
jgi:ABC-type transporter Mla MlaB component